MGEWKSRKYSEGHREPASTLDGNSAAEERDVPAEVFLLAGLSIILCLGTWKEGGGEARTQRGSTVRRSGAAQAEAGRRWKRSVSDACSACLGERGAGTLGERGAGDVR